MNPIQSIPSSTMQAKTCSICLATSTCKWYKDLYDERKNRCASCYKKSRKDMEKFCSTCEEVVTSSQWHKDPYDKTKNHCASCYNKAIRNIEKLCSTCEKIVTSSQWHKDPKDETKHRCRRCYDRTKYQNKKRNKSLSFGKEALLNTGSSLGNFKNIGGGVGSELSDFHALESHSKRKIDPPKNSSSKLQRAVNFSPANNTPLGNNLDLDSFEFNSDVIDDSWGLLEMEDSDNP